MKMNMKQQLTVWMGAAATAMSVTTSYASTYSVDQAVAVLCRKAA